MSWPPRPEGRRWDIWFQQSMATQLQSRPIMRATPRKRSGVSPRSDTEVSIQPHGQARIAKAIMTTGSTVTPCRAVQADELCFGWARSHSPFMMENQVQEITAAMPKSTPIQKSRPVEPEEVMYWNSVQLAITRPKKMSTSGGVMEPHERPRPSR